MASVGPTSTTSPTAGSDPSLRISPSDTARDVGGITGGHGDLLTAGDLLVRRREGAGRLGRGDSGIEAATAGDRPWGIHADREGAGFDDQHAARWVTCLQGKHGTRIDGEARRDHVGRARQRQARGNGDRLERHTFRFLHVRGRRRLLSDGHRLRVNATIPSRKTATTDRTTPNRRMVALPICHGGDQRGSRAGASCMNWT